LETTLHFHRVNIICGERSLSLVIMEDSDERFLFCSLDVESRPWDFQAEECLLRSAVDRFNNRRYGRPTTAVSNQAAGNSNVDNSQQSQLGFTGDKIVS